MAKRNSMTVHQSWTDRAISILNQVSANKATRQATAELSKSSEEVYLRDVHQQEINRMINFLNAKRTELSMISYLPDRFLQTAMFALSIMDKQEKIIEQILITMVQEVPISREPKVIIPLLRNAHIILDDYRQFMGFNKVARCVKRKIRQFQSLVLCMTGEERNIAISLSNDIDKDFRNIERKRIMIAITIVIAIIVVYSIPLILSLS